MSGDAESTDSPSTLSHSAGRTSMFSLSPVGEFPPAIGKEYILRTMVNRPAPWSRPSPQRMYCVLTSGEFRLAGAFTTDTNFVWLSQLTIMTVIQLNVLIIMTVVQQRHVACGHTGVLNGGVQIIMSFDFVVDGHYSTAMQCADILAMSCVCVCLHVCMSVIHSCWVDTTECR